LQGKTGEKNAQESALDFDLTPEGLAQRFHFLQRPKRDSEYNVADHIRETLRLELVTPEALLEEIKRDLRPKNECWWQLSARFIEQRGRGGGKPKLFDGLKEWLAERDPNELHPGDRRNRQ
jgi:hypothetical protein